MSQVKENRYLATAFLAGSVLSAGWYASTAAILTGLPAQTIPLVGAISIAALAPSFIQRKLSLLTRSVEEEALMQQLQVLKNHTMVNVVDTENRMIEVNDLFLEATGYSREDLIGRHVAKLYPEEDDAMPRKIRKLLGQGRGWQGETTLRRKDGSYCITQTTVTPLHDPKGNWIGSISARTDITEATQMISERETAMTLHELRDDIWIVCEKNQILKYMNRAAKARFNIDSDSDITPTLGYMATDHDCGGILEGCAAVARSGNTSSTFKTSISGKMFEVSIKWLSPRSADGKFLIMFHDLTDQLQQEQQQADFISTVSHELRSPLTSIKGSMGLLLSGAAGTLPAKAEGLLEISHRNADRLVLIINDILDVEKISSGRLDFEIKQVDMSEMVKEALRANATAHQRFGLQINCVGIEQPNPIETDANRIIQVLTNLMSNAAKFSKPGSSVEITVENSEDQVRVSVRDEGMGISPDDQHKIFQRFADMTNSDRATKGGTGLGLSICKAIVEGLGGNINFESVEGQGTTFMFALPIRAVDFGTEKDVQQLRNVG